MLKGVRYNKKMNKTVFWSFKWNKGKIGRVRYGSDGLLGLLREISSRS